jgi:Raf kinase inhibitor-like YbhB/YbcL family protein
MQLRSDSFHPYAHLASRLAFAEYDPGAHARLAGNRNPHLAWSNFPKETKSFAVLCYDPDVPSEGSRVNREGMTVPIDLRRVDFFHWVLCDLPPTVKSIAEGSHSDAVTPRGKPVGKSPSGGLQGLNDYTGWFASDLEMRGDYAGYDGPCPPWNDERVHGYRFSVFALDVPTLGLSGRFTGHDVRRAMAGHILEEATQIGVYAIYPGAKL